MFENLVSKLFSSFGYQISKIETMDDKIKKGHYRWLQQFGVETILDIGANVGKFALMMNKILGNKTIYCFEPLKDCFEHLVNNTKHIDNIQCFNIGLGSNNKTVTIYHNEFSPSSSLLEMSTLHKQAFPYTKNSVEEEVKIVSLDEMQSELELNKKILLKIDVQGYELEVLKGADELIRQVDLVIVETSYVELYKDQPLYDDIYQYFLTRKFQYMGNFGQFSNPSTGEILQGDAIFFKK